jgi:hypothetical protein
MKSALGSHTSASEERSLWPKRWLAWRGLALSAWTLAVIAGLKLNEAAADVPEAPRLFAQPIVRGKEQWILVSVLGGRKTGALVSVRFSFASSEAPPEDRDLWMEVRPRDRSVAGMKVPTPRFGCSTSPRPIGPKDFVRIDGRVGISVATLFECFSPLVDGARYEVTVHLKTTPPGGLAVPADLLLDELVAAPIILIYRPGITVQKKAPTRSEPAPGAPG